MKKIVLTLSIVGMLFGSCQNSNTQKNAVAGNDSINGGLAPIAYVDMDSVAEKFQFCIDQKNIINQKQASYDQKLQAEGRQLQNYAQQVQQKIQNNGYSSQQQYEAAVQEGQRKEATFNQHQQEYQADLMQATENYISEVYKRIREYLKDYNKDGRYSLILTNSGNDVNVLVGSDNLNITDEVIEGLNKAYKKSDNSKEEAKEAPKADAKEAAPASAKK
ncbi:MAG: OmpH family outer membrane protein [Alloprevotella sp.]|nr:OmpH family outer membrane protein [Alloprevotella sp.]